MKVLVAEDDRLIREGLAEVLEREGYSVVQAADGDEALAVFEAERPDFACLDIMMPGRSGYDVCRELRQRHADLPIIFITAKSEEIDKVLGLELGADDYILKPFGVREVVARMRAVTRRYLAGREARSDNRFEMGGLVIDGDALRASRDGELIDLSLRDIAILRCLYRNRGKVVSRQTLFDECWGRDYLPSSRSLDQHISQLRKRIERDPVHPAIIQTAHGSGYRFE